MKAKRSFFLLITLMASLGIVGGVSQKGIESQLEREGLPVVNAIDEKDVLPGAFRMSSQQQLPLSKINDEGLDRLNVSGSAQFSEFGLDALLKKVARPHLTVVNLRNEEVVFIAPKEGKGAIAFSYQHSVPWFMQEDEKSCSERIDVERAEEQRISHIDLEVPFTMYGSKEGSVPSGEHHLLYKIEIPVKLALTEKELVIMRGQGYCRLAMKKFGPLEFEVVDTFVNFMKSLPEDEWVHFHCQRGQRRTTFFMAMTDILRNGHCVSFEDIIYRQGPEGLGGIDLFGLPHEESWNFACEKENRELLRHFYCYVRENKISHFEKSFSCWAKEKGINPSPKAHFDRVYRKTILSSHLPSERDIYRDKVGLVLNTLNESKLSMSNFRSTQDLCFDTSKKFNLTGLDSYFASGSSQYTKVGLKLFMDCMKKSGKKVMVIDLRHDTHLFINGLNVSRFENQASLRTPRDPNEILASEKELKEQLLKKKGIEVYAIDTRYPKNDFDKRLTLVIKPTEILTPEELVKSFGADYYLIGCKRFSGTSDEDMGRFVEMASSMPEETWFHFHCKKGKSRTTFFMILLDMMRNADRVSFEDIIYRQYCLGGINLLDITPKDPLWPVEKESKKQWVECLARFHRYCSENKASGFKKSWPEWSKENEAYHPSVDHLVFDRNLSS